MSSRKKARECLLKALYLAESRIIPAEAAFAEMAATDREIERLSGEPEAEELGPFALGLVGEHSEYALALARRIEDSRERYNGFIRPALVNWELERVARIDRIIMWIALAEMECMLDVPPAVSVDEAVELARKFSSAKSPGFVNGVLDTVARSMGLLTGEKKPRGKKTCPTGKHR